MSIKKPYKSWHRADIRPHSRPLKARSWARKLPDSPHFSFHSSFFFYPPCLSDLYSLSLSSLSVSNLLLASLLSLSSVLFVEPQYSSALPSLRAPGAKLPPGLHAFLQDLEEELELDRRRVSEAEGMAKRAEEELAVAKERLLLQEDELQSRAGSHPVPCPCLPIHLSSHLYAEESAHQLNPTELNAFTLFIQY